MNGSDYLHFRRKMTALLILVFLACGALVLKAVYGAGWNEGVRECVEVVR